MSTQTTNLGLNKPDISDKPGVTIPQLASNFDLIDLALADKAQNVMVKGAKGDGVTDDTTVIQSAINSATQGIVYFPPNHTFLTTTLTVSNPNVILFLNNCTLKTDGITITGANSGILGNNGTIDGKLKVTTLATQATNGATSLTLSSMPFVVGDGIQSSYGLGSDGSDPIPIQSINGNTVTFPATFVSSKSGQTQNSVSNTIPVGAYIGNFQWSVTVSLQGNGSFLKGINPLGLNIVNSRGYSLTVKGTNIQTYVDQVFINNNGLDILQTATSGTLNMSNSKIGFIYDISKQGIVLGDGTSNQSPKVYLDNVTFNRQNSDPDFFLNGTLNNAEIRGKRCTFIGTGGVHPAGSGNYNGNSYACVTLNANVGSTLKAIELKDCVFQDYEQGLITEQSGNTVAQTITEIDIKNCKGYNVVLGNYSHTSWNRFDIEGTLFDGQNTKTNSIWWVTNGSNLIQMKSSKILNDVTTKNFQYFLLQDVIFDHSPFSGNETSYGERITAIESPINTYPSYNNDSIMRMKDLTIQHSQMATSGYTDMTSVVNVLPSGSGILNFKFKNGNLGGFIYNNNYKNFYVLDCKLNGATFRGGNGYSPLYGDDWYIPQNSKIENVLDTSAARIKYVTKSAQTTLFATASSGATSLSVASGTGIAVNDYINIKLDNGRVWNTTVSAISGTTVTIANALPSQASSGNNVCDFLY